MWMGKKVIIFYWEWGRNSPTGIGMADKALTKE